MYILNIGVNTKALFHLWWEPKKTSMLEQNTMYQVCINNIKFRNSALHLSDLVTSYNCSEFQGTLHTFGILSAIFFNSKSIVDFVKQQENTQLVHCMSATFTKTRQLESSWSKLSQLI